MFLAHKGLSIIRLSRDGYGCVIKTGRWPALRPVALWALESNLFREVSVWPTGKPLAFSQLDLNNPQAPELGKALQAGGLKLVVATGKKLKDCPDIIAPNVTTTADKSLITGTVNGASSVTPLIKAEDLYAKAPAVIGVRLAQGLEQLTADAKKSFNIVSLSRDGQSCTLSVASLLAHAHTNPFFSIAEEITLGKAKAVVVYAPAQNAVTASFNPSRLLAALREETVRGGYLNKSGQSLAYRFYFCAVNGYGQSGLDGPSSPPQGYAFQDDLKGFKRSAPHAVVAKCPVPAGVLHAMNFGAVHTRIVEKELAVDVGLLGNRSAWSGVPIKASMKGEKKSAKIILSESPESVSGTFALPSGNEAECTFEIDQSADALLATIAPVKAKLDLTPKLIPGSGGGLNVVKTAEHVILWCRSSGVAAPKGGALGLPFVHDKSSAEATQAGAIGQAQKSVHATTFELLVTPNDTLNLGRRRVPLQSHMQYYLPVTGNKYGFVTHEGIFAARIPKGSLKPNTTYTFQLAAKANTRGNLGPLEATVRTDSSFGHLVESAI